MSSIRIRIHIEYFIKTSENSKTIRYIIICDFNNSLDIRYPYLFIFEHFKAICETNLIKYEDAFETSYSGIKTSDPYISTDDTIILAYVSIIRGKLFEVICDTKSISYLDATKASSAYIMTSELDNVILEISETSGMNINDITLVTLEGAMC